MNQEELLDYMQNVVEKLADDVDYFGCSILDYHVERISDHLRRLTKTADKLVSEYLNRPANAAEKSSDESETQ